MKKYLCTFSLLLAVNMVASPLVGYTATNTVEKNSTIVSSPQEDIHTSTQPFILPDIVDAEEATEYGYVGRVYADENDLNTFVFKNSNGTNTMRIYSHPVKYTDENNKVKDISLDIKENADGSFSTAEHEIVTTFEKNLSDGIRLNYDDLEIKMIPETGTNDNIMASSPENTENVEYTIDDTTSYVYGLTYSGFKEDIVVEEYTGQTEYDFTLYTNGLTLCEEAGSYYLKDSNNETKANIGDIIVFTADERNNTFGTMTYETVTDNEEYLLTIHLNADYLQDPATAYPIRIDPTIEINYNSSDSAIKDVTINSNGTSDGTSGSLYVGKRSSYGISRVLMGFPGLQLGQIHSSMNVENASVEIRDLMCESESLAIECLLFEGNSWSESSASWSSANPNKYSSLLSTVVVSYSRGEAQSTPHRYSFNIKNAVTKWVDGTFSKSKGIIFKAKDSIENGSTYKSKTFASYNRAEYRPSVTITYTSGVVRNQFYSKYDPSRFNAQNYPPNIQNKYIPQYRMNCYGYAFRYILDGAAPIVDGYIYPYKQQPGNFTSAEKRNQVKELYNYTNATDYMNAVVSNIKLDAERVGYAITECPLTSSTAQQYGTSSRLIALVTGYNGRGFDYHFYMQHNDGTWSHKPGATEVTNLSLDDNVILTNENIYSKANQGTYTGNNLKFFLITKSAVIDQPHTTAYPDPTSIITQTVYFPALEKAGDYFETPAYISTGSTNAQIDFAKDHDVYCFTARTTKTYTITTTCSEQANLNCMVYDANANIIGRNTTSGRVNLSISLNAGSQYYIDIYNSAGTYVKYTLTVS